MATATPSRPSPGLPKTVGILNLIFGGLLTLCGLGCMGSFLPGLTQVPPPLDPQAVQKMRQEQIDEFKKQEAAAATDEEKAAVRKEREEWETQSAEFVKKIDLARINLAIRRLWTYMAAEIITAPLLNVLMLISGVGLIFLKNWARVLAVWVAVLKIVRLIALAVFATVFVWPGLNQIGDELVQTDFGKSFLNKTLEEEQKKQGNAGPPQIKPEELVQMTKASSIAMSILFYCACLVYPVIAVVLLTLPGARLACARPVDDEEERFPNPDAFA